jgi:hypothetical protein
MSGLQYNVGNIKATFSEHLLMVAARVGDLLPVLRNRRGPIQYDDEAHTASTLDSLHHGMLGCLHYTNGFVHQCSNLDPSSQDIQDLSRTILAYWPLELRSVSLKEDCSQVRYQMVEPKMMSELPS